MTSESAGLRKNVRDTPPPTDTFWNPVLYLTNHDFNLNLSTFYLDPNSFSQKTTPIKKSYAVVFLVKCVEL